MANTPDPQPLDLETVKAQIRLGRSDRSPTYLADLATRLVDEVERLRAENALKEQEIRALSREWTDEPHGPVEPFKGGDGVWRCR
jgi:hypothetical protein